MRLARRFLCMSILAHVQQVHGKLQSRNNALKALAKTKRPLLTLIKQLDSQL